MLASVVSRVFGVVCVLAIGATGPAHSAGTPDSGVVAFERGGDIFVANVDGSGEKNLTRVGVGPARYPDVSPDGKMIAFAERVGGLEEYRTAVMNVDGTGLHRIGNVNSGSRLRWAPDGSLIAYGGRRLDVVAPDGAGLRTLATDAREFGFAWSPDGREIAYGSDSDLRAVDVVTGSKRTLAATAGANNIAWSMDGSKIAFMRFAGEVWLVGRDGSALRKLVKAEFVGAPSWSPDSNQIAVDIYDDYPRPSRILIVDVATGRANPLTSPEFGESSRSPSWSPDGSRIAYTRERIRGKFDDDVWVMNADGSGKVEVTFAFPLGTSATDPEWVPGLTRVQPDIEVGATVAARPRRVLKMTAPAETLLADKGHALFEGAVFGVWSIRTGRVQRIPGGCEAFDRGESAIAGTQVAWVCREEGLSFVHEWLSTATLPRPHPADVVHINYSGLSVAGGGSLMIFSTGRKIWRLDGKQKRLLRIGQAVARVLSADAGRALLERKDGSLAVIAGNGKLIRTFRFAQQPLGSELAGEHLVVLTPAEGARLLQVYRLSDGKRIRSWPMPAGGEAELQAAHGRRAAYVVGIAIHIIDLMNGRDAVLRFPRQAGPINTRFVPGGLVYSYGQAYSVRPGRLGFIPLAALVKSLP